MPFSVEKKKKKKQQQGQQQGQQQCDDDDSKKNCINTVVVHPIRSSQQLCFKKFDSSLLLSSNKPKIYLNRKERLEAIENALRTLPLPPDDDSSNNDDDNIDDDGDDDATYNNNNVNNNNNDDDDYRDDDNGGNDDDDNNENIINNNNNKTGKRIRSITKRKRQQHNSCCTSRSQHHSTTKETTTTTTVHDEKEMIIVIDDSDDDEEEEEKAKEVENEVGWNHDDSIYNKKNRTDNGKDDVRNSPNDVKQQQLQQPQEQTKTTTTTTTTTKKKEKTFKNKEQILIAIVPSSSSFGSSLCRDTCNSSIVSEHNMPPDTYVNNHKKGRTNTNNNHTMEPTTTTTTTTTTPLQLQQQQKQQNKYPKNDITMDIIVNHDVCLGYTSTTSMANTSTCTTGTTPASACMTATTTATDTFLDDLSLNTLFQAVADLGKVRQQQQQQQSRLPQCDVDTLLLQSPFTTTTTTTMQLQVHQQNALIRMIQMETVIENDFVKLFIQDYQNRKMQQQPEQQQSKQFPTKLLKKYIPGGWLSCPDDNDTDDNDTGDGMDKIIITLALICCHPFGTTPSTTTTELPPLQPTQEPVQSPSPPSGPPSPPTTPAPDSVLSTPIMTMNNEEGVGGGCGYGGGVTEGGSGGNVVGFATRRGSSHSTKMMMNSNKKTTKGGPQPFVKISNQFIRVKATVLITSTKLLNLWEEQCHRYAPTLQVERFHPPSSKKKSSLSNHNTLNLFQLSPNTNNTYDPNENEIRQECMNRFIHADIIITTATIDWPDVLTSNIIFHRIVLDESHLLGKTSAILYKKALCFQSAYKWCVSSTPAMKDLSELEKQATFLGLYQQPYQIYQSAYRGCLDAIRSHKFITYIGYDQHKQRQKRFQHFINVLSTLMIRIQKEQESDEDEQESDEE